MTSEMLHTTPLFYMTVFLCVAFSFAIDLLVETIKVNLLRKPE